MIVDIHTHVWPYPEQLSEKVASEFVAARRRKQQLRRPQQGGFPQELVPQEPSLDLTLVNTTPEAHWEHAQNADLTVVLAFRSRALGINVPNEYVAQYVKQHPERLIGFACVDPNDKNAVDELEESVLGMGLRGLKLAPIYQCTNWRGVLDIG